MTEDLYASINRKLDLLAAMPERLEAVLDRLIDLIDAGAITRSPNDNAATSPRGHS